MKKIGIFLTNYSLMLYILWNRDWKETCYLLYNYFGNMDEDFFQRLDVCGVKNVYGREYSCMGIYQPSVKNIPRRILRKIYYIYDKNFRLHSVIKVAREKKIEVYGQDHLPISKFFHYGKFNVIEDGLMNYRSRQDLYEYFTKNPIWCANFSADYVPGGWDNSIQKVYLTGRLAVPKGLQKKAVIQPLSESWEKIPSNEKKEILYLFDVPLQDLNEIAHSGRNVFFLSSGFVPQFCTEEEWIRICKKMLSPYDLKHVVIKLHPGEPIDYKKYFPECHILQANFPFEFVYFLQVPIKKVVSVRSTALYGFLDSEQIDDYPQYDELMNNRIERKRKNEDNVIKKLRYFWNKI